MSAVLQFPATIASAQDVAMLLNDLKAYHQWFTHNDVKQKVGTAKGTPPPVVSDAALDLLRQAGAKRLITTREIEALIRIVEKSKSSAPQLTITLAAPAPGEIKRQLTGWVRSNLAPNALITYRFNASILGGMVVRTGSRVFDWSLKRNLMDKKDNFVAHLNGGMK